MSDDPARAAIRLRKLLMRLKNIGEPPFRLLLGDSGSSVSIDRIETLVLEGDEFDEEDIREMRADERTHAFRKAWKRLGSDGQFACLRDALKKHQADPATLRRVEGHRHLACLMRDGYFDVVFTSNLDTLLEDALIGLKLPACDWQVLVLGRDSSKAIQDALGRKVPRIKIVKLSGDLYARVLAIGQQDALELDRDIENVLRREMEKQILVVGHRLESTSVIRCIPKKGDLLYYVNETPPPPGSALEELIDSRNGAVIAQEAAEFGRFFEELGLHIIGGERPDQIGLQTLAKAGIDVNKVSDDKVDAALSSNLVTLIDPKDNDVTFLTNVVVAITLDAGGRLSFEARGALTYKGTPRDGVRLDVEDLNRMMRALGRDNVASHLRGDERMRASWRERAIREGKRLFDDLFGANIDFGHMLGMARAKTRDENDIQVCFVGPRAHLGIPYELLYDSVPWAVHYPISRQVQGVEVQRQSILDVIASLQRRREPLRVLLVGGESSGIGVAPELLLLRSTITDAAIRLKIATETRCVTACAAVATAGRGVIEWVDDIPALLQRCPYHLVHYCGHGAFDAETNEGYLSLRAGSGDALRLSAHTLGMRLPGAATSLFFLNCCMGAATAGEQALYASDYLGLMDAVVAAGVPAVVGYRWPVRDKSARDFAVSFYEALLETRSPAQAVLRARRDLYERDPTNETWTTAVLVDQRA